MLKDYPQVFCFLKQQSIQSRKTVINKHYLRGSLGLDRFCFKYLQGKTIQVIRVRKCQSTELTGKMKKGAQ